jgi:hypothetical protein
MVRATRRLLFGLLLFFLTASASFGQSGNFSSITAISQPLAAAPIPIFSMSRTSNVITANTVDPDNPDEYAELNQVGVNVTIANITVDPSNAANGTFTICGPPTPGCSTPTRTTFSYISNGVNFSASGENGGSGLGYAAVARTPCPLIPTGHFSFCGDSLSGSGLEYPGDGSLIEFISTQDEVGSMLWASALGTGNSGITRATGCEQYFIESGNEWHFECSWMNRFGGYIDVDMLNDWLVLAVGDGLTARGVGGELALSGTRGLASFGTNGNRTVTVDMATTPAGTVIPSSGILRFRNGSTVCWENIEGTNGLCQGTNANDQFSFDGGVVTPTYNTASICESVQGICGSGAAGSVAVSVGSNTILVTTTAVTPASQIFIQEDSSLGAALGVSCNTVLGRTYMVTNRSAGTSFQITASQAPVGAPACLSYHIIN